MEISVNRALAELKLCTKKINDKILAVEVAKLHYKAQMNATEVADFIVRAEVAIQSVQDLIKHRNCLKTAIVMSNAITNVLIGNTHMTVAEAIERKTAIGLDKQLLRKLRESYFDSKNRLDSHNASLNTKADQQAASILGVGTDADKSEQYKAIVAAYVNTNEVQVAAPEGIETLIDDMQDAIDDFEKEVDFVLSESNIKTLITV